MVGREGNGMPFNSTKLRLGKSVWPIGEQTGIVGILNVTPDSFSDGGGIWILNWLFRAERK